MSLDNHPAELRESAAGGRALVIAGVGSGLTARAASAGGADALAVYATAIYRVRGLPTALSFLPYDNANALTLSVAPEITANAAETPVLVGLGVHDPRESVDCLLDSALSVSATGVTNEPFVGLYGPDIRAQLDAAGIGFARELQFIERAVERKMLALGWVFSATEAVAMARTGAHVVGVMLGITAGTHAGGSAVMDLDEATATLADVVAAVASERDDALVLAHGGPLDDPSLVAAVLRKSGADGYVTGSTGERLPVHAAVRNAIGRYKAISLSGCRQTPPSR